MNNKLRPIEFKNERIITTRVLAEKYECKESQIQQNFNNHSKKFILNKHYYLLQGDELREFKRNIDDIEVAQNVNKLYLWTERGILRHAKILDTEKAWDMYEELEDTYFKARDDQFNIANTEIEKLQNTVSKFERLTEEAKLQYKPSHKRKLDYNKMIKSLTNNDEEVQIVKDWVFGLLNIEKWEDTCVDDSKKIIETITTVARLLTIKRFEQLTYL